VYGEVKTEWTVSGKIQKKAKCTGEKKEEEK